ncbi:MAG: LapA family protein [Rhodothermales bacterium]
MRTILAFALALITVLFGFENQTKINIQLGPYAIEGTVAVILISTFIIGILTGILATLPSSIRRRRLMRNS